MQVCVCVVVMCSCIPESVWVGVCVLGLVPVSFLLADRKFVKIMQRECCYCIITTLYNINFPFQTSTLN